MARVSVPRPTPNTPFRVVARNKQVAADWELLVRQRKGPCTRCWDHLAATPREPIGTRYLPLKGDQATCVFEGQTLPQWHCEIDGGARVKVGIGRDFVVLMGVWTGHPKENE